MENKRFKQGLVALLAAGAIAITAGLGGCNCNKKTQRIDDANYYEQMQIFAKGYNNLDIKKAEKYLKELEISPNKIKKLNKEHRKRIAIDFNKDIDANFIDPNHVSNADINFIHEIMRAKYEGHIRFKLR